MGSADPADVVVPHMAVSENPLLTSSPTDGFAPNKRRRYNANNVPDDVVKRYMLRNV